jgi:hypothetical protein
MNWNIWTVKKDGASRMAAVAGLAAALLMASAGTGLAHPRQSGPKHAIEGTWLVRVTLRNCDTNASLGSVSSLVTFHEGGTVSETTGSSAFAIGQRSPGHGVWESTGHHTYAQRMVALINFDTPANLPGTPGYDPGLPVSPGFFAGWYTISHVSTLTDENHNTSSGTNAFYKADGTRYRTGCSTAESTRFE